MRFRLVTIGFSFLLAAPGLASAQAPGGSFAWQQGYNQRLGVVDGQSSYYRYYSPGGTVRWHAFQGGREVQDQFDSYNNRYDVRRLWDTPSFTPAPLPPARSNDSFPGLFSGPGSSRRRSLFYDDNAPRRR